MNAAIDSKTHAKVEIPILIAVSQSCWNDLPRNSYTDILLLNERGEYLFSCSIFQNISYTLDGSLTMYCKQDVACTCQYYWSIFRVNLKSVYNGTIFLVENDIIKIALKWFSVLRELKIVTVLNWTNQKSVSKLLTNQTVNWEILVKLINCYSLLLMRGQGELL